jgi:hypothetical protein
VAVPEMVVGVSKRMQVFFVLGVVNTQVVKVRSARLPGLSYSDALRLGLVVVEEDEFPEELSAVGLGKLLEEFTVSMAAACATSIALAFEKLVIEVTR